MVLLKRGLFLIILLHIALAAIALAISYHYWYSGASWKKTNTVGVLSGILPIFISGLAFNILYRVVFKKQTSYFLKSLGAGLLMCAVFTVIVVLFRTLLFEVIDTHHWDFMQAKHKEQYKHVFPMTMGLQYYVWSFFSDFITVCFFQLLLSFLFMFMGKRYSTNEQDVILDA
jgi:hypothetical protein